MTYITAEKFIESFNSCMNSFIINLSINEICAKQIRGSVSAFLNILKKESPNAKYNYTFTPINKPTSLLIEVVTEDADWIETKTELFIAGIKDINKLDILSIGNEQIKFSLCFSIK